MNILTKITTRAMRSGDILGVDGILTLCRNCMAGFTLSLKIVEIHNDSTLKKLYTIY